MLYIAKFTVGKKIQLWYMYIYYRQYVSQTENAICFLTCTAEGEASGGVTGWGEELCHPGVQHPGHGWLEEEHRAAGGCTTAQHFMNTNILCVHQLMANYHLYTSYLKSAVLCRSSCTKTTVPTAQVAHKSYRIIFQEGSVSHNNCGTSPSSYNPE